MIPVEYQELLDLTDTVEQFDANRLQHLLALAQLRQVPLPELLQQLNISTVGITPTGRATIDALNLNRSGVKNIRRLLVMADLHPPNLQS
ncbi:MAG: hypothetical protein RLZZ135_1378 [Cyanobacteriota bacterium]